MSGYNHGEMVVASCSNLTFIACFKKCHHKTNDNNVVFHFFTDIFEGFLGVLRVLHPCAVLSPVSHKKMLPNCQRREWCVATFQVTLFIFLKHFNPLINNLTNVSRILTTISDVVSNQQLENDARSFDMHCDLGVEKVFDVRCLTMTGTDVVYRILI